MILTPRATSFQDRINMRPKQGDMVVMAGSSIKYEVIAVGSKFYRLRDLVTGDVGLGAIDSVVKYVPPPPQQIDEKVAEATGATTRNMEDLDREFLG